MKQKDQQYKDLQKLWYNKIQQGGFKDIEDTKTGLLKEWNFNFFRNQFSRVKYESTLEYYEKAKQILLSYGFKTDTQKRVWELHCEGFSERKIAVVVKTYKKSMIHYIIANIAREIKS